MSKNSGSSEPVSIQAADFVSVPTLFNRWAMEAGAVDFARIPLTALQALNQKEGAELYLLQGTDAVPPDIKSWARQEKKVLLDTADGVPLRFHSRDRSMMLAALYRAYVLDGCGPGDYRRCGKFVFRLGAVGIHREEADSLLAAARAARPASAVVAASPVPASVSALGQLRAQAQVLALVPSPSAPEADAPTVALTAAKSPGEVWTEAHLRELVRQFKALREAGEKAAGAHIAIAKAWGIQANSVRTYLAKGKALPMPGVTVHKAA